MTDMKNSPAASGSLRPPLLVVAVVAGVAAPAMAPRPAAPLPLLLHQQLPPPRCCRGTAAQVREVNDPVKSFQGRVILNG